MGTMTLDMLDVAAPARPRTETRYRPNGAEINEDA